MCESRCGVCCNNCGRKEKVNCKGCISMEKPFWGGVCDIKSCCESKGVNHCGVCAKFPCNLISNFGKEQGYDPASRLDQCREWATEN